MILAATLLLGTLNSPATIPRPLINYHSSSRARAGRQFAYETHFAVLRDGRVLGQQSSHYLGGFGWVSSPVIDHVAPRAAVEDLGRVLSTNRAGWMPAACGIQRGLPSSGRVSFTWYGQGNRSAEIVVDIVEHAVAQPCPDEVAEIVRALTVFFQRVMDDAAGQPVPGQS